ncbi:MAG: DUF4221 domain-containing protein [Bacteroidales bacterium]|nr:DUF4221 domain-containing protein [Bacteroidales bacterium]
MKNLFIAFIPLAILVSCAESSTETKNIKHNWETIILDTKNNSLAQDDTPYLLKTDTAEYYVNYNHINHCLNFYNLNTKSFNQKIQFYKSGPDKLSGISEYVIHGDTLIVHNRLALRFFNKKGRLIKAFKLPDINPLLGQRYSLEKKGITIDNLMELAKDGNKLILRTFNRNKMPYEKDFNKNLFFCKYDLKSNTSEAIKVKQPKEIKQKYYYADLATPHIITNNNLIIYNFHFKSSIFVYNQETESTKEINFEARNIPNIIDGIKRSKASNTIRCVKDLFFGSKFYNIKYDPYRNLYYLLYGEKIDMQNSQDEGVKRHLIVFNKLFKKLGEITINPYFSNRFVISKYGILFRNSKEDSYNELKLHALKINI